MKVYELKNEFLTVKLKTLGGELVSIVKNDTGVEYLWNGDEKYWKRNAPILFPLVGSLKGGHYTYDNQEYAMGQHGFARDMVFRVKEKTENSIWFSLSANEETLAKYPFQFLLELGYILTGSTIKVCWRVVNEDDKTMYFSIGGHPAFMCPLDGKGSQTDYYLLFDTPRNIYYGKLDSNGLLSRRHLELSTQGGVMRIDADLFAEDALIIEE
ncbi:MAG: aldose 1-epimerase family protein, partial [Lachnospiraceae bacterium]|nr:aldose 1-epimerase family protein [Lachnospiraceae bacterium]